MRITQHPTLTHEQLRRVARESTEWQDTSRGCTDIALSSSIPMRLKGIDYHDNSHDTSAGGIPMGAP